MISRSQLQEIHRNYLFRYFISKNGRKTHIHRQFVARVGYQPDFENPRSFNEKIQWLKLNYRDPLLTKCSDKLEVRKYIREKIGESYLVELLDVYDRVGQIDLEKLPDKFALRINHGSGQNLICRDKSKLDWTGARNELREWIKPKSNHYYYSYEWGYKGIRPRIVCEKHLEDLEGGVAGDFRLYCFNGRAKIILVCSDVLTDIKVDYFDLEWNKLPIRGAYQNIGKGVKKPERFDLLVELAEKLARPFPFVRVDFLEVGGEVYFGEMTFYPGNGTVPFSPMEWDHTLGDMLVLPRAVKRTSK